jgi:protoporphyrinogen oxidase
MPSRPVAPLAPGDEVIVIGAGPAGLTAAYLLSKARVKVTVLEADDTVGGISRTVQYKGFRFDIGGHRFFTKIAPVQELWHEILGQEFISVPRLSRIYYDGRFFDYPLKAGNALRSLGALNAALILLSYLRWQYRPHPVEENFEQWVTNRFGKRLYEIFFRTYTEKVWGIPCTEIRAEWAAQRIQGLSLARAILNAASINKRSTTIKTLINEFQYPRLGPGQMWEMCRDRVVDMGAEVLLRHRVVAVETSGGSVTAVRTRTPEGERRFTGQHFISTAALRSLISAMTPSAPDSIRIAAEGLKYRDFVVVALVLDRDKLFPDNWIYIHTPGVQVGRIQNFNNWSAAMVPEPGRTCLGMEYFCFKGDGLWNSSDDALIAQASRELEQLGLARACSVVDGSVIRMPKAYPIYDSSYRQHLEALRSYIDPIPNLHTVGRNGMHKYNNQDHSMLTAMMTVWNMQGAAHDVWAVNTDFDYHEEQKLAQAGVQAPGPARAGVRARGVRVDWTSRSRRDRRKAGHNGCGVGFGSVASAQPRIRVRAVAQGRPRDSGRTHRWRSRGGDHGIPCGEPTRRGAQHRVAGTLLLWLHGFMDRRRDRLLLGVRRRLRDGMVHRVRPEFHAGSLAALRQEQGRSVATIPGPHLNSIWAG